MVRNEFFDIDKSVWWNNIELDEKVNLNEWHSFCLAINLEIGRLLGKVNTQLGFT